MENTELKKWATNHPPIISIFGSWAATSSEAVSIFLELTKEKTMIFDFGPMPSSENWLSLYHDKNRIRDIIIEFLKKFDGTPEFLGSLWEFITNNPNWLHEDKAKFKNLDLKEKELIFDQSKNLVNEIQEIFFSELTEKLDKPFDDEKLPLLEISEVKFVYSVIIPSYVYYGVAPFQIFKNAQKGYLTDIEKILRLDASTLGDPQIFQHFHLASKTKNKSNFNIMINALQNPPKGKTSLQKVKYKIAGLISALAESLNYHLTTPEIEKLFDAMSKDLNKPELRFIESDDIYNDSITRHIRREKRFWYRYFKLDKK